MDEAKLHEFMGKLVGDMGGAAMIRSLETISPGIRIISASGLPRSGMTTEQPAGSALRTFLSKPFTAEQLLRAVHDMLAFPIKHS